MNDNNFKPFDKVLVRADEIDTWMCDLYSHYDSGTASHICIGGRFEYCIPYEGNEALLCTTDSPQPKRWRAEKYSMYWFISSSEVCSDQEDGGYYDDKRHEIGNYFQTKEEAEEMANKFKEILKEE